MMSEKLKGKYRSESARMQCWDYGNDAAYFITICAKDRQHFFGEIQKGKIQISSAGAIAHVLWFEIKNHAKNIELGEFAVMPNHVHGILILNGNDVGTTHVLSLPHALSLQPSTEPTNTPTPGQQRFQNQGKNTISSIIGSYKSAVSKHCNQLELPFAWQTRFHDHIIRNDESFERISEYIKNNPANWTDDKFFS
jgi:putative transposase